MHRYRSHTCGALRDSDIGKDVRLSGWCHRIRDHGGLLFIDLRDHYGLTQVVADPDSPAFKVAETLRAEWVVRIDGKVRRRPDGTENAELPTGRVEVYITEIEVLGPAGELPMPVFGDQEYPEETRLKYRFLDLRRDKLHQNIMTRGAVIDSIRRRMKEQGFFEFQTPILTASSPEGARDYLVPSRIHPGKFYALPQAPQQFKQLIMVSGFDRYFQIAPCFRDEDARADRSPGEFYQLDLEMSFVTQQDVFDAVEPVMRGRVRGVRRRQGGDAEISDDPLCRGDARIRHRQAGPAQPAEDAERQRSVPRLGLQDFRRHDRLRSQGRGLGDPGAEGRQPRLLRPHERLGAARGPAGARLHLLARGRGERRGAARQEHRPGANQADRRSAWPRRRRRGVLHRRQAAAVREVRRSRAHQGRRGAWASLPRTASTSAGSSTSRCSNGTRRRRRSTSPTTRSRCRTWMSTSSSSSIRRRTRTSCSASRRSSTTSSATAWSCRPARSGIIAPT